MDQLIFQMLKTVKRSVLESLSINCGLTKSFPKLQLWENLVNSETLIPENTRNILSVDLGLKNIALCHLQLDEIPRITDWKLVSLGDISNKQAFIQPKFALLASEFVREHLLGSDLVLIEQQRIRSNGAGTVPETISRLNILEGMIHAILAVSSSTCQSFSVNPASVMSYWIRQHDPMIRGKLSKRKRYTFTKQIKTNIASNWIRKHENSPVTLDISGETNVLSGPKTDDLYDSLFQAITFLQWNKNRNDLKQMISSTSSEKLSTCIVDIQQTMNIDWTRLSSYPEATSVISLNESIQPIAFSSDSDNQ